MSRTLGLLRMGLSLLALAGCATAPPPRQLLDARAAYNKARMGKAAQYAPADLHTAKVALNAAEQAYQDDAESPETFALAYVALRTAQLVESRANTKAAEAELQRIDEVYKKIQEDEVARTRGELARAQAMLSEQKSQLAMTSEQLAAEKAARAALEAGLKEVRIHVNGPGSGRESAIRAIQAAGLEVSLIKDTTKIPHNGCRPRKRRRV